MAEKEEIGANWTVRGVVAYFIEFAALLKPELKNAVLCVTGGFRVSISYITASAVLLS